MPSHKTKPLHRRQLCIATLLASCASTPHEDRSPKAIGAEDTSAPQADTAERDTASSNGTRTDGRLSEVIPCPAPLPSARWTESAEAHGLPSRPDDGRATGEATYIAVHDFDQDGHLDLIMSTAGELEPETPEPVAYLKGSEAGFVSQAITSIEALWQPSLGDLEGDGDLDVLLAGSAQWLENISGDLTARHWSPVDDEHMAHIRELEVHDADGDGHPDLFALGSSPQFDQYSADDTILRGDGFGEFTETEGVLPADRAGGVGFDSLWLDWDGDGELEIYVANDRGPEVLPNVLWTKRDGTWQDIAPEVGADSAICAMGVDVGDLNRDGRPDLYLSASISNKLLMSHEDGVLIDATLALNADPLPPATTHEPMGWGGIWVDHDNDGNLDILAALGDWWHEPMGARPTSQVHLLQWDGSTFTDVASDIGIHAEGSFRGVVAQDFNRDGLPDFLISSVFGRPLFYLSDGCTDADWLEVEAPSGSRVTVKAGGETWVDWVTTSSGFGAASSPISHFGLGSNTTVDSVRVQLPDGEIARHDGPFESRRRITFLR